MQAIIEHPARSIGVGLFAGAAAIQQLWLFWTAPLIGALGGVVYKALFNDTTKEKEK